MALPSPCHLVFNRWTRAKLQSHIDLSKVHRSVVLSQCTEPCDQHHDLMLARFYHLLRNPALGSQPLLCVLPVGPPVLTSGRRRVTHMWPLHLASSPSSMFLGKIMYPKVNGMKGRTRQEGRHTGTEGPPSLGCAGNPEPENTML